MENQNQNQNNTMADSVKNTELDTCKKQAEEYLNNWKRERADFINYKKDEIKRMGEFIQFAGEAIIMELLDNMDDLYLAAKDLKNSGLDQIIKKFEDSLKKYGVEKIKTEDKFDPITQEAVSRFSPNQNDLDENRGSSILQSSDAKSGEGLEGERIEEVRAGYTMHGRVIRPARVKIIK